MNRGSLALHLQKRRYSKSIFETRKQNRVLCQYVVVVKQVLNGEEKISTLAKAQASIFALHSYLPACFNVFSYLKMGL